MIWLGPPTIKAMVARRTAELSQSQEEWFQIGNGTLLYQCTNMYQNVAILAQALDQQTRKNNENIITKSKDSEEMKQKSSNMKSNMKKEQNGILENKEKNQNQKMTINSFWHLRLLKYSHEFESCLTGTYFEKANSSRREMSAIDICDSEEEDEALQRKQDAIRRRRAEKKAESQEPTEDPKVALELPELPVGPWDCPPCGEQNGEKRLKCNNCGRPRPGTEAVDAAIPKSQTDGPGAGRRKRTRGWDDWEEQAKKAAAKASAQNASIMKDVINSWKPTVEQLKAMTVAELQPICKSWKIFIEPKDYMRDVMLSKALKVIHGVDA